MAQLPPRNGLRTANFNVNAVLRGLQLTFVGAHRVLQNPSVFKPRYYHLAARAILLGLALRILIAIPIGAVHLSLWSLSLLVDLNASDWDEKLIKALSFVANSVLQLPSFLLLFVMRYLAAELDDIFLESLAWVDKTYEQLHGTQGARYSDLAKYYPSESAMFRSPLIVRFTTRYIKKAAVSLAIYGLTFIPLVGRLIMPLAGFETFRHAVGVAPASAVFAIGIVLPQRFLTAFLSTYFASRGLMRELLKPYLKRLPFDAEEKRLWFKDREGVLFGFGVCFFMIMRVPLLGIVIYGVAQASTAYLVTKISAPPPSPAYGRSYVRSQIRWTNKHKFFQLPLRAWRDTPGNLAGAQSVEERMKAHSRLGRDFT